MEKTRLFEALSTLTNAEIKEFDRFLASPLFNRKAGPQLLFQYYKSRMEAKQPPRASDAFAAIFSEAPYDDQKMRLANSALLTLLEQYFIFKEKNAESATAPLALAAAYRKKGLEKHFQQAQKEATDALNRQTNRHAEYYNDLYLLEYEQYQFLSSSKRTEALNIQEMSDLLDTTYLARKLRLVCFALTHSAVYNAVYDMGLLTAVVRHIESAPEKAPPAVLIYYAVFKFLSGESEEQHFAQFNSALLEHAGAFPEEELRNLYLLAINFGIKKLNESSHPHYLSETLTLYRNALSLGILLENGTLSRFAYNNIAAIALRNGEVEWAETFIHHYKKHLEKKIQEVTFNLNFARIAYAKKDYKNALIRLQDADYKDLINNLVAKTLQLKIYYELGELELLESHLASMQIFVKRQHAMGYHRKNWNNIIRYTRLLLACTPERRPVLRQQIEAESVLTEKNWFIEQLEAR